MKYCGKCGEENRDENLFCMNCGNSFDPSIQRPRQDKMELQAEGTSDSPSVKRNEMSSNIKEALSAAFWIGIIVALVFIFTIVFLLFKNWNDLLITIVWIVIIASCAFKVVYMLKEKIIDWAKKRKSQKQEKLDAQKQVN